MTDNGPAKGASIHGEGEKPSWGWRLRRLIDWALVPVSAGVIINLVAGVVLGITGNFVYESFHHISDETLKTVLSVSTTVSVPVVGYYLGVRK
jgi:capsular polysaccharide biosynthesis protein